MFTVYKVRMQKVGNKRASVIYVNDYEERSFEIGATYTNVDGLPDGFYKCLSVEPCGTYEN